MPANGIPSCFSLHLSYYNQPPIAMLDCHQTAPHEKHAWLRQCIFFGTATVSVCLSVCHTTITLQLLDCHQTSSGRCLRLCLQCLLVGLSVYNALPYYIHQTKPHHEDACKYGKNVSICGALLFAVCLCLQCVPVCHSKMPATAVRLCFRNASSVCISNFIASQFAIHLCLPNYNHPPTTLQERQLRVAMVH